MKRLILIVAALAFAGPAVAADLPVKARIIPAVIVQQSFAGFYAGIQTGYGWSQESMSFAGNDAIAGAVVATGAVPASLRTEGRGWNIGGVAGYNWQNGAFLAGIETSLNWSDLGGSQSQLLTVAPLGLPLGLTTTAEQSLDWYGRLVGRLGVVVFDRALIYVDGGLAYGGLKNSASITLIAPAPFGTSALASVDQTKAGWTIGAGFEAAIADGWRLKAGYEYLDFGGNTLALNANVAGVVPVSFTAAQDNKFHVAKIGLLKGF